VELEVREFRDEVVFPRVGRKKGKAVVYKGGDLDFCFRVGLSIKGEGGPLRGMGLGGRPR
jgi:hypothetical protein